MTCNTKHFLDNFSDLYYKSTVVAVTVVLAYTSYLSLMQYFCQNVIQFNKLRMKVLIIIYKYNVA